MPKNSNHGYSTTGKKHQYKKGKQTFVFENNDERKHKDYQEFINLLQLMNNLKRPEQITRVERILTKQ